jgi:hypothetical protein
MTGKEMIDKIQSEHLEDATLKVFATERNRWIDITEIFHYGNTKAGQHPDVAFIDADYRTK